MQVNRNLELVQLIEKYFEEDKSKLDPKGFRALQSNVRMFCGQSAFSPESLSVSQGSSSAYAQSGSSRSCRLFLPFYWELLFSYEVLIPLTTVRVFRNLCGFRAFYTWDCHNRGSCPLYLLAGYLRTSVRFLLSHIEDCCR